MEKRWQSVESRELRKVKRIIDSLSESAKSIMNEIYLVHDRDIDGCFASYLLRLRLHKEAESNLDDNRWMCGKQKNTILSVIHRQGGYSYSSDIDKHMDKYISYRNIDSTATRHKNIVLLGVSPDRNTAEKIVSYMLSNPGTNLLIIDKVENNSAYELLKDYWVKVDATKITSVSHVLNMMLMDLVPPSESPYPNQIIITNVFHMIQDVTYHTILTSVPYYFKSVHEEEIFINLNLDIDVFNIDMRQHFISNKLRALKKAIGVNAFIRQVFAFYICKDGLLLDVIHKPVNGIVSNRELLSPRLKKQVDDIEQLNISMYYESTLRTGYVSGTVIYVVSSLPFNIDIADYILNKKKEIQCVVINNIVGNKIEYYSYKKNCIDTLFDFTGKYMLVDMCYMKQHSVDGNVREDIYHNITKANVNKK